jgi:hypothetical protein
MRVTSLLLALQLASLPLSSSAGDGDQSMAYQNLVSLSGKTFRAVEIAVSELRKRGLSVEKYLIVIHEYDPGIAFQVTGIRVKTIAVTFQDPDRGPGLGSGPNMIGFSVSLDADTLEVTGSSFVK